MESTHRNSMVLVIVAMLVGMTRGGNALRRARVADPWTNLENKTAWVILGTIESTSGEWVTQPSYHVVRSERVGDARMAMPGDELAVIQDLYLYILGFQRSGEARLLDPPIGVPTRKEDYTGGVLKPGARVRVRDVRRETGSECTNLCAVWARVTPMP